MLSSDNKYTTSGGIFARKIEPNGFGNRDLVERVKVRTFHADGRKEGQRLRFFRGMDRQ
jgi:hypothetical protein